MVARIPLALALLASAQALVTEFAPTFPVRPRAALESVFPSNGDPSVVVAIGNTTLLQELVPDHAAVLAALGPEGFLVRTVRSEDRTVFVAHGNASPKGLPWGEICAAYALAEELGWAFLHPLERTPPMALDFSADVTLDESPAWPDRGLHIHTQHPTDFHELLQGWGTRDPFDRESWEAMLPDLESSLEWMVANRINRFEWSLLEADSWANFSRSEERLDRFRGLADLAHSWGILIGVDCPIVFSQQHAFRVVIDIVEDDVEEQKRQLRESVDYIVRGGFDFLSTEIGTSEFSSPEDTRMLELLDEYADYLMDEYGMSLHTKVHITVNKFAENFVDPETGEPLNYNFLPYYASRNVGVMPHTVQVYALDDPAPTYNNVDFSGMLRYMRLELEASRRSQWWFPETQYWINADLPVGLSLGFLYADRRIHDWVLIAEAEAEAGARIDGHMTFSSGWELGAWFGEVVNARAAWRLPAGATHEEIAREAMLPAVRVFGSDNVETILDLITSFNAWQRAVLIEGRVGGQPPPDNVEKLNGLAYLVGWDTWAELASGLGLSLTQPDRLGQLESLRDGHQPDFDGLVRPLLVENRDSLRAFADKFAALSGRIPPNAATLWQELVDSVELMALRAEQVLALYDGVRDREGGRIEDGRRALEAAQIVMERVVAGFRLPRDRLASWHEDYRTNPTVYKFDLYWQTATLFFWVREQRRIEEENYSPCFMNIQNGVDVVLGEGGLLDATIAIREWLSDQPAAVVADCIAAPLESPLA